MKASMDAAGNIILTVEPSHPAYRELFMAVTEARIAQATAERSGTAPDDAVSLLRPGDLEIT